MNLFETILRENLKKVSACVIIYDKETKTFLVEHSTGMKWKGNNLWGLPKGEIDEGEQPNETAIREVREECRINLDINDLIYLGHFEYIKSKDLEMFLVYKKVDTKECHCDSYFERNGQKFPEVNGFKIISIEDIDNEVILTQAKILHQIIAENQSLF